MIKQILLQVVLIALNAFFAATEIAVISLNEKKVRALADDGNKKAISVEEFNSNNAKRLNKKEIIEAMMKLSYIQEELSKK